MPGAAANPFEPSMPRDRFRNPWPHDAHGWLDILKWKVGLPPRERALIPEAPEEPAGRVTLDKSGIAQPPARGWRVVWLGHASFLLQGAGISILVDPVLASHCGPLPLPVLRRRVPAPFSAETLPPIHAVLLTHSHYDHLDLPTLRDLGTDIPLVVPSGHRAWLMRVGFRNVTEVSWYGHHEISKGVVVTATPAQHFTARSPWDRDLGHWCGWRIEGSGVSLWHAGDSGYCPAFREIGERLGPVDLGMIPIGAYQPRHIMRAMHMNPEEAVRVFEETRCRKALAMHWGTFRLTDEPLGEPPLRLAAALESEGIPHDNFVAGAIGQSWEIAPPG